MNGIKLPSAFPILTISLLLAVSSNFSDPACTSDAIWLLKRQDCNFSRLAPQNVLSKAKTVFCNV